MSGRIQVRMRVVSGMHSHFRSEHVFFKCTLDVSIHRSEQVAVQIGLIATRWRTASMLFERNARQCGGCRKKQESAGVSRTGGRVWRAGHRPLLANKTCQGKLTHPHLLGASARSHGSHPMHCMQLTSPGDAEANPPLICARSLSCSTFRGNILSGGLLIACSSPPSI